MYIACVNPWEQTSYLGMHNCQEIRYRAFVFGKISKVSVSVSRPLDGRNINPKPDIYWKIWALALTGQDIIIIIIINHIQSLSGALQSMTDSGVALARPQDP
jgi:hypothetical protein